MAESRLTLDLYDLQAEVGRYAGFGYGSHVRFGDRVWTAAQQRGIDSSVASGVRTVYFTQEMEGVPARYEWSWLRPTSTLTLDSAATAVTLPDDFNGMLADSIPASVAGEVQFPIPLVGLGELYRARSAGPTTTGRPSMAYVEPVKGTAFTHSSRYTLQVWPTADQAYTLRVWYEVAPDALTTSLPFIYGGPALSECFRASVRASYERDFDNLPETAPEQINFKSQLRAAIAGDRKFKPLTIGPNLDHSDSPYRYAAMRQQHGFWGVPLEINGVTY